MLMPAHTSKHTAHGARLASRLIGAPIALILIGFALLAASAEAAVPRGFFGISAVRPTEADFERMGQIGAGSYRIEIGWPSVQAHKGAPFSWGGIDQRFRRAALHDMKPMPIIFGAPGWLTGDFEHIRAPIEGWSQRKHWEEFAAAVVQRYGPGGDFWEANPSLDPSLAPDTLILWNEQNARAFWHPAASPQGYAALLRTTRRAIDSVNPSLKLIVGGMYGFPQHSKSISAKTFLSELYRERGASKAIDGVSVHPYATDIKGVRQQVKALRRVMNRAGDRRASLYIGETGWASAGPPQSFLVKTKARQARLLTRAYRLFLDKRREWKIKGTFWFTWRDYTGAEICGWCPKAGLLNVRSQLKPSGQAFEALIRRRTAGSRGPGG